MTTLLKHPNPGSDPFAKIGYEAIATELAVNLGQMAAERDEIAGVPAQEIECLRNTGLLPLVVPQAYGGIGASWPTAINIVQTLARGDSSTAQLYGYHLLLSVFPQLIGTAEQAAQHYRDVAQHQLFWANAVNTRDLRLTLEPDGKGWRAKGTKSFCTGAVVSDRLICAATQPDNPLPVMFVLPPNRAGLTYNHDWDTLGQRRTASGSYTFEDVRVEPNDILGPPPNLESAFPTVVGIIGMLVQAAIFSGIAEAALGVAQRYTQTKARPWETATVEQATEDPYTQRRYGELWSKLQGAKALLHDATEQFQQAWDKGEALTHAERAAASTHAAAAKTLSIQVGLNITNQMFDLMGARAVANRYGYDRYWRNLRTLSLHDPLDYKLFDIGNWVVNEEAPIPSLYA